MCYIFQKVKTNYFENIHQREIINISDICLPWSDQHRYLPSLMWTLLSDSLWSRLYTKYAICFNKCTKQTPIYQLAIFTIAWNVPKNSFSIKLFVSEKNNCVQIYFISRSLYEGAMNSNVSEVLESIGFSVVSPTLETEAEAWFETRNFEFFLCNTGKTTFQKNKTVLRSNGIQKFVKFHLSWSDSSI